MMKITFHGAARTVTGTRHLIEAAGKRVLLDCGLAQGPRKESEQKNRNLPFDAKSIDAVVLSHAHIDHAGNLPTLVKRGFDGPIFTTPATRDLANAMLTDSAHIQQSDAEHLNKNKRPSEPPVEPLYGPADAQAAVSKMATIPYGKEMSILPGFTVKFRDAGHILGSAVTTLTISDNGSKKKIVFTGDLGRKRFPILRDPLTVEQGDVYITESTYGDRDHGDVASAKRMLAETMAKTVARHGKVIVPAFALGRAQSLVYLIHELCQEGSCARCPIYVDSPLSIDVTAVYKMHPECFDPETIAKLHANNDPFGFHLLTYLRTPDDSRTLNDKKGSFVVIAASGMCEGGRVLHHLKHNVGDPANTVLIVGFCAQNTLGRRLADGAPVAKIFGIEYPVRCQVARLDGLSQHAGRQELLDYAVTQKKAAAAFCVHGEEDPAMALAASMRQAGFGKVEVPELGQSFEL